MSRVRALNAEGISPIPASVNYDREEETKLTTIMTMTAMVPKKEQEQEKEQEKEKEKEGEEIQDVIKNSRVHSSRHDCLPPTTSHLNDLPPERAHSS